MNQEETVQEAQQVGPEQMNQAPQMQIDVQTKIQLDLAIINAKLQILDMASKLVELKQEDKPVMDVYKELRLEILGQPNDSM